jgi:hypothetical protein
VSKKPSRWAEPVERAREQFGTEPFTIAEFAEVLRPFANPMEMARLADRQRASWRERFGHGGPEHFARRDDDVTVGLRAKAAGIIRIRWQRGSGVERVDAGVYRFTEPPCAHP